MLSRPSGAQLAAILILSGAGSSSPHLLYGAFTTPANAARRSRYAKARSPSSPRPCSYRQRSKRHAECEPRLGLQLLGELDEAGLADPVFREPGAALADISRRLTAVPLALIRGTSTVARHNDPCGAADQQWRQSEQAGEAPGASQTAAIPDRFVRNGSSAGELEQGGQGSDGFR